MQSIGFIVRANRQADIQELRDTEQLKSWQLPYKDVIFVLFEGDAPLPWCSELVAFDLTTGHLKWRLTPHAGAGNDWIDQIMIREGNFYPE